MWCSDTEHTLAVARCWDCQERIQPSESQGQCWGHLPLAEGHIQVPSARGRGQLCPGQLGHPVPSARHCSGAQNEPQSHRQAQVLSMNYIPFPRCREGQKYPVVLQGNINAVFGLWCSSARLPITRGSIVQTRIPC